VGKKKYPTEPLRCWAKAKEIRENYYKNYALAKGKGGIRWTGGAWSFDAIPMGLGDDVFSLSGEPYAATTIGIPEYKTFGLQCLEACAGKGYAHDLCPYMRTYFGSVILNQYAFGGEFPRPDFLWQTHICCSHSKWFQNVSDLLGGIPLFSIDVSVGPYKDLKGHALEYVVSQMHEGIEWLEKVTGRKYDDERLIEAVYNHSRASSLWAEVCTLNKAIPAPLDEKSMFSLFNLGALTKASKEIADFYEEVRDEVKDRVDRGIAAVGDETFRYMTDAEPPWSFLRLWRYLEDFGGVSIGSIYSHSLIGMWEDQEDGSMGPRKTPKQKGIHIKDRDQALRVLADWQLALPDWQAYYDVRLKSEHMIRIAREWHCDYALMHFNRGCEGTSVGLPENRAALINAGIPTLAFEGNMADPGEVDEVGILHRVDVFLYAHGHKRLQG
jgi:benzoyl-CoA reductase subunit B